MLSKVWKGDVDYTFFAAKETPFKVMRWKTFSKAGKLLRESECKRLNLLVDYEKLGRSRKHCLVVFVSHRWLFSEYGRPDDEYNTKYRLLVAGLRSLRQQMGKKQEMFVWVDYSCMPQDSTQKMSLGIASLPAYMERCDAIVTPIVPNNLYDKESQSDCDDSSPVLQRLVHDMSAEQKELLLNLANFRDLCDRSWMRLEYLMGNIVQRPETGHCNIFAAYGNHRNDRPHFLILPDMNGLDSLLLYPRLSDLSIDSVDPLEGDLFDSSDKEKIDGVIKAIAVYTSTPTPEESFEGDLDEAGLPHGAGVKLFSNGDKFEGVFEHGHRKHGTMFYFCGNMYTGEWKDDKPHGNGKLTYLSGDIYEGCFERGERSGEGKYITRHATYYGRWHANRRDPSYERARYETCSGKIFLSESAMKEHLHACVINPAEKEYQFRQSIRVRESCVLQ